MGSLPTQGAGSGEGLTIVETVDENITVTTSMVNVMIIDSRVIEDSVITLYNSSATENLTYKIYASSKNTETVPNDNDDSWINIMRDLEVNDSIPSNYNHNRIKTLPKLFRNYESFTNKWGWLRIQMQVQTGTIIAKVWHRGSN